MGSGSFPLSINDAYGEKLISAALLVEEVIDSMIDDVYSGDSGGQQFDNAARDGASLARLRLAVELIRREVEQGAAGAGAQHGPQA